MWAWIRRSPASNFRTETEQIDLENWENHRVSKDLFDRCRCRRCGVWSGCIENALMVLLLARHSNCKHESCGQYYKIECGIWMCCPAWGTAFISIVNISQTSQTLFNAIYRSTARYGPTSKNQGLLCCKIRKQVEAWNREKVRQVPRNSQTLGSCTPNQPTSWNRSWNRPKKTAFSR